MSASSPHQVTELLAAWKAGDRGALDRLLPLVEQELYRLAAHYMRREHADHTLQTTALVNEAYLRLIKEQNVEWQNRAHFFAVAASVMRRILIGYARRQHRAKRGGGAQKLEFDETAVMSAERSAELIDLNEALERLAALNPRQAQVVELEYFGGLTAKGTAHVLGVAEATVNRDWRVARAWLGRELSSGRGRRRG